MRIPGWGLPEVQVQAMATTIRRAARLLWALHLSFQDGFDSVLPGCCPTGGRDGSLEPEH